MNRLRFNDFEITKREIIASISIFAIMLLIGVLISSKISESQLDKNEMYNKSIKIQSKDLFEYGMNTNIGNAFVYGDLITVDPVTYDEIDGQYMSITKIKERYTKHKRKVKKKKKLSDGSYKTYYAEEEYWTWDEIDRWLQHCNKVTFLGIEFDYGTIYKPHEKYITTQKESSHVRYVYYGSPIQYTGTMFGQLTNKTVRDVSFYNGMTIEETVDRLESNIDIIIFWIIWTVFIGLCIFGFYYLDNNWLEN